MPMLALNGYSIPVASDSLSRSVEQTERMTRQASGQMSRTYDWAKRHWTCKTPPITWEEAQCLRDWLLKPAWVWNFTNTLSSDTFPAGGASTITATGGAYQPSTGTDGVAVTGGGGAKFGTYSGAAVNALTNLLTANVVTGTDTSSNTSGFTAVGTASISSSTAAKWAGSRSLLLTVAAGGDGVQTDSVAVVTNTTLYAGSFYVRSAAAKTLTVQLVNNGSVIATKSVDTTTLWQRVVITGTTTSTSNLLIKITQATGTGTHYLDAFQMETTYRSIWTASSRSASVAQWAGNINGLLGTAEGMSIAAWVTPSDLVNATIFTAWDYTESTQQKVTLQTASVAGTLQFISAEPSGSVDRILQTTGFAWPTDNGWTHVAAVLRPTPTGADTEMAIYINGALNNSSSPGVTLDPTSLDRFWVANSNGSFFWANAIDNLAVFPYALTAGGVSAVYNFGAVPSTLPLFTATGSMIPEGSMTVCASIKGIEIAHGYTSAGTFLSNRAIVEIEIEEQ